MVSAFRFGFLGVSDVDVGVAYTIMIGAAAALFLTCLWLMNKGVGMRE
jgi:ABC-2 type transport system permease protein